MINQLYKSLKIMQDYIYYTEFSIVFSFDGILHQYLLSDDKLSK